MNNVKSIFSHNLKNIGNNKEVAKNILNKTVWKIFRMVLLIGISFVTIYPFIVKFSTIFKSYSDVIDSTVKFVPKSPTLNNINLILTYGNYFDALKNTVLLSLIGSIIQTFVCIMIGYGLGRFKFKGNKIIFILVFITLLIPPQVMLTSLYMKFRFFDIANILTLIGLGPLKLIDSFVPVLILSLTGLGFKNGLYIFVFAQSFRGLPKEMLEAAKVDGAKHPRIFFSIMVPMVKTMIITVFLLAFSWQWTDTFYTTLFFNKTPILSNIVSMVSQIPAAGVYAASLMSSVMVNSATLLVIAPLIILFLFAQKQLIQGVERSGLVG